MHIIHFFVAARVLSHQFQENVYNRQNACENVCLCYILSMVATCHATKIVAKLS